LLERKSEEGETAAGKRLRVDTGFRGQWRRRGGKDGRSDGRRGEGGCHHACPAPRLRLEATTRTKGAAGVLETITPPPGSGGGGEEEEVAA
jgi:hypothetical protein